MFQPEDKWGCLACVIIFPVGMAIYAALPDNEVADDTYLQIAAMVQHCPDAQSALDAANKDHKILSSEARELKRIVDEYVKQDERSTKAQNIKVAKGIIKGPPRQRTCVAPPETSGKTKP